MKVLLIRHGKTKGNREHRYVGSTDESLLPEAAEEISSTGKGKQPPDYLFISPLRRCRETAVLLYPELFRDDVAARSFEYVPGLRECDFGEFEYKNYIELQEDPRYQAWIDSGGTLAFPGGESREAFIERCAEAFAACCRNAWKEDREQIGFVVHGGTIMAVLDRFSEPHKDYFAWQVKNVEGFSCELDLDGEQMKLTKIVPVSWLSEHI